ncbi:MAG: hypothetical protein QOH41_1170 [Blastocatellia bacterium]|jgi:hypothetical protein|nr:hypothetical protein [Blastocatellia bacterium]
MNSRRPVNSDVMFLPLNYPRLILAIVVAPQAALLLFVVASLMLGMPVGELEMALMFYVPFAYGVEIVFGLPLFLLFNRQRWTNVFAYFLAGLGLGLIVALPLVALLSWSGQQTLLVLLLSSVGAGLSALLFRIVLHGIKRRSTIVGET